MLIILQLHIIAWCKVFGGIMDCVFGCYCYHRFSSLLFLFSRLGLTHSLKKKKGSVRELVTFIIWEIVTCKMFMALSSIELSLCTVTVRTFVITTYVGYLACNCLVI